MKNLELKLIVPFMYLACLVPFAGGRESSFCPGHEALVASETVLAACRWDEGKSSAECTNLVHELSSLESPTTQQRYDLAFAVYELADFADREGMIELLDRAGVMFRALDEELPNDTSLLSWRYYYSSEDEERGILRRILQVAPDCSQGRIYLLESLGFATDYLDDPDVPEDVRAEISHHISVGYDLAVDKMWKMRFGAMMFDSLMVAGRLERAKQLQKRIFAELDVANLRYDDASGTENLRAICDSSAFGLRFTKHCLDAIEETLTHDIGLGGPLSEDVLLAIKILSLTLTWVDRERAFDEFSHPADVNEYSSSDTIFFPGEAVRYAIRLGDMIRSVPDDLQTFELHLVSYVLGRKSKLQMLETILRREPTNDEVRGARDSYLEM